MVWEKLPLVVVVSVRVKSRRKGWGQSGGTAMLRIPSCHLVLGARGLGWCLPRHPGHLWPDFGGVVPGWDGVGHGLDATQVSNFLDGFGRRARFARSDEELAGSGVELVEAQAGPFMPLSVFSQAESVSEEGGVT